MSEKKLKRIYIIKDVLAASVVMVFSEIDDNLAKRRLEGFIVSPNPNMVNTFVKDKQVYCVAELDEKTMMVNALPEPEFICEVDEIFKKVLKDLCHNEKFIEVQKKAIKAQKELLNGKPITRKNSKSEA